MFPTNFSVLVAIKDSYLSTIDNWFFNIWCVSFVEVPVRNFRLLLLIETDLKRIVTNCENEMNKLPLNIILRYFIMNF